MTASRWLEQVVRTCGVASQLQATEDELQGVYRAAREPLQKVLENPLLTRGKRVRPICHFLAAGMFGYRGPPTVQIATAIELIHLASLCHDDVIDGGTTRRGLKSVNARFGNTSAILAGDWLITQAFTRATDVQGGSVLRSLLAAARAMVEGEWLQLTFERRLDLSGETVIEIAEKKTGALFGVCFELAGQLTNAPAGDCTLLLRAGRWIGTAFQLIDDVMDYLAGPAILGKRPLHDLGQGRMTMPLLYALDSISGAPRHALVQAYGNVDACAQEADHIRAMVAQCGAAARVYQQAEQLVTRAVEVLSSVGGSPSRPLITLLAQGLLNRYRLPDESTRAMQTQS